MGASVGDEIIVRGPRVGSHDRHGVLTEVRGADGGPPYLVQWSDGHEGLFYPSADATVVPTLGGEPAG